MITKNKKLSKNKAVYHCTCCFKSYEFSELISPNGIIMCPFCGKFEFVIELRTLNV